MPRRFPIAFDDDLNTPVDEKKELMAVAPIDAFSGRIVGHRVKARIAGLPDQPVRNLSGLLIFQNLPKQDSYAVQIKTASGDYFDPPLKTFVPPSRDDPDQAKKRRLDVQLLRRPTFPFEENTTRVAGVIVRAGKAVDNASIKAELPPQNPPLSKYFETRSDERGAFILALRLPPYSEDLETMAVAVTLHISDQEGGVSFVKWIKQGELHSLQESVDLVQTTPVPFVGETIVEGELERAGEAVVNARVSVELSNTSSDGPSFVPYKTSTDQHGAFALTLLLPETGAETDADIAVIFHFKQNGDERRFMKQIRKGGRYRFETPIDLNQETEIPDLSTL